MSSSIPRAEVLGVEIDPLTLEELLARLEQAIRTRERLTVGYANVHGVLLARRNPEFQRHLRQLDIVFCDGYGLRLGARVLGHPLPERYTAPDWIDGFAARGHRLFLLGSRPGVAERAGAVLHARSGAVIAGTHHGYFDPTSAQNEELLAQIHAASPDIIVVGMGMPRQEAWALTQRARHDTPVVLCVGALFDYLAGVIPRGGPWLTDHGLEWLSRLWFEPRRLWRRYLIGNPTFAVLVLREWWRQRRQQIGPN